jgi:hypothetical protein
MIFGDMDVAHSVDVATDNSAHIISELFPWK